MMVRVSFTGPSGGHDQSEPINSRRCTAVAAYWLLRASWKYNALPGYISAVAVNRRYKGSDPANSEGTRIKQLEQHRQELRETLMLIGHGTGGLSMLESSQLK
jgi:hypothetical protein